MFKTFYIVLFIFTAVLLNSCSERDESRDEVSSDTIDTPNSVADTIADNPNSAQQDSILDLKGTYTGTFDQRPTTLKITEQNGKEFKGVITINYREVINQTVSGEVNTETNSFTMKDLVHSRFMGTYEGNISNGGEKLSGTFIMNLDKSNFNFSLTKK